MTVIRSSVRTSAIECAQPVHARSEFGSSASVRFFWCVLIVSVAVSISGNAVHAVLHARSLAIVAAAVAVVPPVALMTAVHGVTMLLRAHARSRLIHLLTTFMTMLIAAGAFRLSFTALRDLAVMAGISEREAWIWPVIVEGSQAQATLALLAIAHTPITTRAHAASPMLPPVAAVLCTQNSPDQSDPGPVPDAHECASDVRTPAQPSRSDESWIQVARLICASDPARRRDPTVVARVPTRHHEDGWSPSQIAREMDRSRSSVSRIISQARDLLGNHALSRPVNPMCLDALGSSNPEPQSRNSVLSVPDSSLDSRIND